jgi:hypothetical protein
MNALFCALTELAHPLPGLAQEQIGLTIAAVHGLPGLALGREHLVHDLRGTLVQDLRSSLAEISWFWNGGQFHVTGEALKLKSSHGKD